VPLILKALAAGELHGLGVSRRIAQVTAGTFQVQPGSLFPALHRLEEAGWLASTWKPSENNRRAKYYRLTRTGTRQPNLFRRERVERDLDDELGAVRDLLVDDRRRAGGAAEGSEPRAKGRHDSGLERAGDRDGNPLPMHRLLVELEQRRRARRSS